MTDLRVFRNQLDGRIVDLSKLESEVMGAIKAKSDPRIIKPEFMHLSDLHKDRGGEGLSWDYEDMLPEYKGEMILSDENIISMVEGVPRFNARFEPTTPSEKKLYHDTTVWKLYGDNKVNFQDRCAWGDIGEKAATYLKFKDMSSYGGGGGGLIFFDPNSDPNNIDERKSYEVITQFEIDRDELMKTRNIFHDPDGLIIPEEHKKAFIIFGGIPYQAISDFKIIVRE